jgi:hypothetical protein
LQTFSKDLREQGEKRRLKIVDLESRLVDSEKIIQDYDKRIKLTQQ